MKRPLRTARGYTLVEVLVVVTILGIAAAMIVPSMGSTSSLKVQGAVRTLVADITEAQSDALAYQTPRAIVFYPSENRYVVVEVRGNSVDPETDTLLETSLSDGSFGDAHIEEAAFSYDLDENPVLIFDELGSPVVAPGSDTAAPTGEIIVSGSGQKFRVAVDAFTGRVTVTRISG